MQDSFADNPILLPNDVATAANEADAAEAAAVARAAARPALPWGNYARVLLLSGVFALVAVMTYQPGAMRLSMLMNMGTPPPGASLAWAPPAAPPAPVAAVQRIQSPAEWRPGPVAESVRLAARPGTSDAPPTGGNGLAAREWLRLPRTSWTWLDDISDQLRGRDLAASVPPQKPESTFRAGAGGAAWPEAPAAVNTGSGSGAAAVSPSTAGGFTLPSLPVPVAPSGAASAASGVGTAEGSRTPPVIGLEPTPAIDPALAALRPLELAPGTATAVAPVAAASEEIDWLNREITASIPGAYLTIYPKLKFIGLCVPGQGYVRKYNQVGVPADALAEKMAAQDGRTPYGRYYIADRHRDADGPRLYLSWPSPEDARRIGLDAGRQAEIESAWQRRDLPPQDTAAGGGVGLTGLRNWVEVTEGGFTLETPAMEEIFTALPDGAWVFVQP